MDAETPSGGRDRMEMDQGFFTEEEEDVPSEALLTGLDLGGMTPFQWNASLGRLGTSPSSP
jgi:hypothetical protein